MNDLLHLKGGKFEQKERDGKPGPAQLPKGKSVSVSRMEKLLSDLKEMANYWENNTLIEGALVSAYYIKIAAKSNRLRSLLSQNSTSPNNTVVGAKFDDSKRNHIIIHYIPLKAIKRSISLLQKVIDITDHYFDGTISEENFNEKKKLDQVGIDFESYAISKTVFRDIVVDSYYVKRFDIELPSYDKVRQTIVTLYKTDQDTKTVLEKIGITVYNQRILDETTVLLNENQIELLLQRAPFLVSMATEDITKLGFSSSEDKTKESSSFDQISIPSPTNEPTIGVIDTLFDERVYFKEWVNYSDEIPIGIEKKAEDYRHGTAVTSIIVDGPRLNPKLDDGCGYFKVKHYGVSLSKGFSSFTIVRKIKEIVYKNPEIKVWNLSLGSREEVDENFISAEATILDQLQYEKDIIFVVSGTNNFKGNKEMRIGSPADSINSIIVNSIDENFEPASYSRKGPVLSFFGKPDISYFGGTSDNYMNVCEPLGKMMVAGTSYAAPWIARKLAYLIHIMGFSREEAKALLIDSAIGWREKPNINQALLVGHGVVPVKIEDVIESKDDEIRFVVNGKSEKYNTYNFNFPVPLHQGKHPFIARATLCYFPKCSRNQGVDYTNTELDIYFGRLNDKEELKTINDNRQSSETDPAYLNEKDARDIFRKWDNIKNIQEKLSSRKRPKKAYKNSLWGLSVKTKERLSSRDGEGIPFGVVVTLKEINGINRIEDFIQKCSFNGWLVNRISIENRLDIYRKINEEIEFE